MTKNPDEIQRPSCIKINKNDFNSLIQDVYINLDNNEFKTKLNKKPYNLKNAEKILVRITIQKISEKEACKLYPDLITPDVTELKKVQGKNKNKRQNFKDSRKFRISFY